MQRAFLVAICLLPALARTEPVIPDRPGFSTGTATVPPGAWQVEMGVQSSYGPGGGDPDSFTAPLLNLRTGLTASTELNLLWDGVRIVDGGDRDGADVMLGAKHRLLTSDVYNLSLLGYLSSQEGRLTPFAGLLWDRQLTQRTGLFGTLQLSASVEAGKRKTNFQPAIGLNFSHTASLGSFVELYADAPLDGGPAATVFDAGAAWLVREDIQLDFNFGMSLDDRSEDFIGAGLAVRF